MPTTVHLQGNFIYGTIPQIILFLFILSPLFFKIKEERKNKRLLKEQKKMETSTEYRPVPLSVKQKYVRHLRKIDKDYKNEKISKRDGYQLLSLYIRQFALEYTGIDLSAKTLAEIRALNLDNMAALIEEYYEPEFAERSDKHLEYSVKKTIEAIEKWS